VHPEARIVDLTHAVKPQDVRGGAFALAAAAPCFPDGTVHVAVVDPGVGTARRPLLVECERGLLVGPDNGLLLPAARALGLLRARELANRGLWRAEVSATFQGRDVFGPVAAHLDLGIAPERVGPVAERLHPLDLGEPRRDGNALVGEVVLVDSFGNCVTNVPAALAEAVLRRGAEVGIAWAGGDLRAPFLRAYAEAKPGAPLLLVGSTGYLEIAVANGSFADRSGLEAGMSVRLEP
jgi:S-adenosylmethionine hydrolase